MEIEKTQKPPDSSVVIQEEPSLNPGAGEPPLSSEPQGSSEMREEANGAPVSSEPAKAFADQVIIGGKQIFEISAEHMFHEEEKKPERKSRWSEPPKKKPRAPKDVLFNPMLPEMPHAYLAITGEVKPVPTDHNKLLLSLESEEQIRRREEALMAELRSKATRWGESWEKICNPVPYMYCPREVPQGEFEYLLRLHRLDEIDRKLLIADYEIPEPGVRSVSPEPIYDASGRRINTTANRFKEKMLREKADIIEDLMLTRKEFVAPHDYQPPKISKKIYLPEGDTENNYTGLILGPKGITQKALESKTNCRISIRGRGSKFKRGDVEMEEPLHCMVQGEYNGDVEKAAEMIEKLLRGDRDVDDIKRAQEVQLQAINGVLRDTCENCGEVGHPIWACPAQKIFKKKVEICCQICKDRSHPTSDCPQKAGYFPVLGGLQENFRKMKESLGLEPKTLTREKPDGVDPVGSTSFITDFGKPQLMALTAEGTAHGQTGPSADASNVISSMKAIFSGPVLPGKSIPAPNVPGVKVPLPNPKIPIPSRKK
jgi:splicing factor 1